MIPVPSGVRVWLAVGHTDMRRGMNSLAIQVQQLLKRDPHAGDLYVFRGKRGQLIKILWHDGIGMSLYAKRLERGRFIWPSPADGTVAITAAQLAYMLEGIDWRNPVLSWRPQAAGAEVLSAYEAAQEARKSTADCYQAGVAAWRRVHPDQIHTYAAQRAVAVILSAKIRGWMMKATAVVTIAIVVTMLSPYG